MHCHIGQKGKINRGWEICEMESDKYTRNENAAEICVKLIGLKWVAVDKPARLSFSCSLDLLLNERRGL